MLAFMVFFMNAKTFKVPVDKNGSMHRRSWPGHQAFIDSNDFKDTLRFVRFGHTNSSVFGIFQSQTDKKTYYMFATELEEILLTQIIKLGFIRGTFSFVRRSSYFGIKVTSGTKLDVLE